MAADETLAEGELGVRWVEITAEVGLDFVHQSGPKEDYAMPAIMGGGAAIFDYDGDGDLDLYLINSGDPDKNTVPNRLYRQEPDGRFKDVTASSGLGDTGYGMGCAVGDIDNDGDLDVFVSNWGPDSLFRNEGDGSFSEISIAAGIEGEGWSTSAAFFDYDRDGFLDLYVARYVRFDPRRECALESGRRGYCGPTQFSGETDLLYRNMGDGRFVDVSRAAGIATVGDAGLGVLCADFDDDGWLDVYVANDSDPNNLWLNQGDGSFVDEAILLGVAFNRYGVGEAGMGVVAGDGDGDGDLDLFMAHLIEETNTYYENRGLEGFEDTTAGIGLALPSVPFTGFGTAFFDYDNDGDLDLAVVNGGVKRRQRILGERSDWFWNAYAEPNLVFENLGHGRFADVSSQAAPFSTELEVSRGLIAADLDQDGDLDLLVTNIEGPARLYRNDGGSENGWIEIRVLDPRYGRAAVGARVVVVTERERYVRHLLPAAGYLTGTPARLHFGLGADQRIDSFEVRWPDGEAEVFAGALLRQVVELRRGSGTLQ